MVKKLRKTGVALLVALALVCGLFCGLSFVFAEEEEETDEQTWIQWHASSGVSRIDAETGVATFTNSKNGDTAFARSDKAFGFNGFRVKLKYGFQDRTSATPDALVAPPALNAETVDTGYNMGFRIHLSSKYDLNDTDPQIVLRFMPFVDEEGDTNWATLNFWVSTGTGYDAGAWIFTKALLAPFYWDESENNDISVAKRADGKFYVTVNGVSEAIHQQKSGDDFIPYQNLETALKKYTDGNAYFVFWNNYSTAAAAKYASKLTVYEMGSTLPDAFTEGNPYGYEFEDSENKYATWQYDAAGKLQLTSQAAKGDEFILTEAEGTRSITGTGVIMRTKKAFAAGDYFGYSFVGADDNTVKLRFEKGSEAGKANLSLIVDDGTNSTTKTVNDIVFNWHGATAADYAVNRVILFREKANFIIAVNDIRIGEATDALGTARIVAVMDKFNDCKLQYENKGAASYIIDDFIFKLPASKPSGWQNGSDGKVAWDSDFNENSILWSSNGIFSAVYTREPAFLNAFGVQLQLDKATHDNYLNVVIASSASYYKAGSGALLISLKKTSATNTEVALRLYNGTTVSVIDTASVTTVSWSPSQTVPFQFGQVEGVWTLYIRSSKVPLDSAKIKTAVESISSAFTNNLAYFQIHSEGDANSAVTFFGMMHHLPGPAVIEGWQSNSSLPTLGAPVSAGDYVMTFSPLKGDTLRIMDKQALIDGFSLEFDMFATPRAGMGHIIIALALKNTWHSLDTGIQIAITANTSLPTDLTKANFGLSMTDDTLGLSNTPLVNYNVPFNWRGSNKIELKKVDGSWKLYLNETLFNLVDGTEKEELINPVKQGDTVIASTITEVMDAVYPKFNGNYAYFQMWNNFGQFTMNMTDINLIPVNTPPSVVPGAQRDYTVKVNTVKRIDLSGLFTDSDGEIVSYTADGGAQIVDTHYLEFTLTVTGEKKYVNVRAYDDRGDFSLLRLSFIAEEDQGGGGCKNALNIGGIASIFATVSALAVVIIIRRRAEQR